MTIIQALLLLGLLLALLLTWKRARQEAISRREAAAWSFLWILAGVVVVRPEVASFVANTVGIGRGADLIVYLSLVLILVLIFNLYVQHHRLQREMTELVRREALKDLDRV